MVEKTFEDLIRSNWTERQELEALLVANGALPPPHRRVYTVRGLRRVARLAGLLPYGLVSGFRAGS